MKKKILIITILLAILAFAAFAYAESVYSNQDLGLSFTAPEGWTISKAEQGQEGYVFTAECEDTGDAIIVTAQKIDSSTKLVLGNYPEKMIFQSGLEEKFIQIYKEEYGDTEGEVGAAEYKTVQIEGGMEKVVMTIPISIDTDYKLNESILFFLGEETMYYMMISHSTEEGLDTVIKAFRAA